MSREESSPGRWHSRLDNSRASGSTIEQLDYTSYSFENETAERPKSSSTPLRKNWAISGSSSKAQSTRRDSKEISDNPENEVDSDNLTYTKYCEPNKKDVESPINSVLKVEEYLSRHETRESDSPDNNEGRRQKRRKSKKQRKEKSRTLESNRTDDEEMYNEDGRSTERRESPENNNPRRAKRRRCKKDEKEKTRILESTKKVDEDTYDEDVRSIERREREESPENNNIKGENRRKCRKEKKPKARILESKRIEEMYNEDGRSSEKQESESPENDDVKREKRRKSKKERKEKADLLESNRRVDDDGYDEDIRPKTNKLHHDRPRISRRRKRRRSRPDSSSGKATKEEKELPITEILRKAQENSRNHYEEPVPLPELTTDTIYVQRRNGFSAVKISGDRNARGRRRHSASGGPTLYPIKLAIAAQKLWNSTALIHQGLLAGMALMHLLLIQTFFESSFDFLVDYSLISQIYSNVFSYLVTMCVVSVFDKFDLAHVDLEHLREIYFEHSRSFLSVPLYLATFCLHQAGLLVDDKISLFNYIGNATVFENNSTDTIDEVQLLTWQKVTLAKDGLAVIAWLIVALGLHEDMLLTHLKTMEKYTDNPEESRREIVEIMRGSIRNR